MTEAPPKPPKSATKRGSQRSAAAAKKTTKAASKDAPAAKLGRKRARAGKGRGERRTAERFAVDKHAGMSFDLGRSTARCAIVDISETGARLKFANPRTIPATFTLFVEEDGFLVDCEIVWRREGRIGVRFAGEKVPTVGQRAVYVDHPLTAKGRKKRLTRGTTIVSKDPPRRKTDPPGEHDESVPPRRVVFGKRAWPN